MERLFGEKEAMKVTTLIPAYKPRYLNDLVTCLRSQRVKPAQVIVSDDSPDQAFIAALASEPLRSSAAELNIRAIAGQRSGAFDNFRHLLKTYGGSTELFHFLLDDDFIYPWFYEKHVAVHAANDIGLSISRRWTATQAGLPIDDLRVPEMIENYSERKCLLSTPMLFASTAGVAGNWLGELSNAVFRADLAGMVAEPTMHGASYVGLEDLGAFLNASLRAPVAYINNHLGFFRKSEAQNSADPMGWPLKLASLAYLGLAIGGHRAGQLSTEQLMACMSAMCSVIIRCFGREADMAEFCALMPRLATGSNDAIEEYLRVWNNFTVKKAP